MFHRVVDDIKGEIFDGAADVILGRLSQAAEAVGKTLGEALEDLAEKVSRYAAASFHCLTLLQQVEVSVAVLWEGSKDDPEQVRARADAITVVRQIIEQVQLWQSAAQSANQASSNFA